MRCPYCDQESRDEEFCDHCNRELPALAALAASAPGEIALADGARIDLAAWNGAWPDDPDRATSIVGDRAVRVHGFAPHSWSGRQDAVRARAALSLSCLAPIEIVEIDGGAVVAAEQGVAVDPPPSIPREYSGDWIEPLRALSRYMNDAATALTELHDAGLAWLAFDPSALERGGEAIRFANLDARLFRAGECPPTLRISPRYSPPEVCSFRGERIGPRTDVFHLGAWAYDAIAGLPDGFAGEGLAAFSHALPALRIFQPHLPPGVAPTIAKATAVDPANRHASVREFADAFTTAVDEVARRYSPGSEKEASDAGARAPRTLWERATEWLTGRTEESPDGKAPSFDLAGVTVAGQAKEALGAENQDSIAFGTLPDEAGCYLVVADGVTHAKAGDGTIASRRACEALEAAIRSGDVDDDATFRETISSAVQAGSGRLVEEALAWEPPAEPGEASAEGTASDETPPLSDADLMSSTLVVAAWDGARLRLANLGDSRAYLVTERYVDQLTVDGDVGATLLAAGAPPEEVRGMGAAAKALATCFGAARADETGSLVADVSRCTPRFASFPTLPGDLVLLCSDGLVDEGVFLDPGDVERIVRERRDGSTQDLAAALVAAANERQRLPSAAEPRGFGDNIACVILRIPSESATTATASALESESDG